MQDRTVTRRRFLRRVGLGSAGLAGISLGGSLTGLPAPALGQAGDNAAPDGFTRLTEHLSVYHGPINVGVLRHADKVLLIDCGDGRVADALKKAGVTAVERILFTHHHRDQACGAGRLVAAGTQIGVPGAERPYFDNVAAYWDSPKSRWHLYNLHPHHLMLAESIRVDAAYGDGDVIRWHEATIGALATPGHTDGSVSYVVEVDGQRIVFCGDAIFDAGQVWDIHSLQKGTQTTDYHGFLGARVQLTESLGRIKAAKPDALVPSHGRIMDDPPGAVDTLVSRLDACYDRYVAISALRHYFPKMFTEYAGRPDHMPIGPALPVPDCLRHFGTTWMLVSKDKAALVMDCGSPRAVDTIKGMIEKGEVRTVEGLWVTHYHDDHVNAIPQFQEAFDCPCIADGHVARVISDPMAWRLPCISPSRARVDRVTTDGQSWQWHEFKLTAFHLPGQTLYHGGLLAEKGDLRMLFVGDSFTAAGIDDYCSSNRNWLGPDIGFDRCIRLIERLKPTHLFNCHVNHAFRFTPDQCRFMRENLAGREELFGRLVPWDHANYGTDEPWVRCDPYEQTAEPGARVDLRLIVTNHSLRWREVACRAILPRVWGGGTTEWARGEMPAKTEGELPLSLTLPPATEPGRYVIPIDVDYPPWTLPQWTEAIVVVP